MNVNGASSSITGQPLYEEVSVIGKGAYGIVYKGYDLRMSRVVAMKRIRIKLTQEGLPISTIREIAYLKMLEKFNHDNVVKLLDVVTGHRLASEQSIILIFEFVDYDLDSYMKSFQNGLGLAKIVDLTRQMLLGVDFLHMNRIIHRDLKPQNILITKEGQVKIADFGLARIYGMSLVLTTVVVTLWYRSPEVLLRTNYTSSVDIWSLGCILAELYLYRPLFAGDSDANQLMKIFEIMGLPNESDWPSDSCIPLHSLKTDPKYNSCTFCLRQHVPSIDELGFDLLRKLFDFNTSRRITARDALSHPFLKQTFNENENLLSKILNTEDELCDAACNPAQASTRNLSTCQLPDITNVFHPNILRRKSSRPSKP